MDWAELVRARDRQVLAIISGGRDESPPLVGQNSIKKRGKKGRERGSNQSHTRNWFGLVGWASRLAAGSFFQEEAVPNRKHMAFRDSQELLVQNKWILWRICV